MTLLKINYWSLINLNTNNLDLKKSEKAQPGFESMMKFCWEEQDRIMKLNLEDPQHSAMSMFGKH